MWGNGDRMRRERTGYKLQVPRRRSEISGFCLRGERGEGVRIRRILRFLLLILPLSLFRLVEGKCFRISERKTPLKVKRGYFYSSCPGHRTAHLKMNNNNKKKRHREKSKLKTEQSKGGSALQRRDGFFFKFCKIKGSGVLKLHLFSRTKIGSPLLFQK